MKKSIICLVSGIIAGIAMCLTAAYEAPFDVNETFAEAFEAHMSALS